MDENFNKFKKIVWRNIFIKCLCWGFAAGLLAVNAVLLPCKLFGVRLLWVLYILIGLGGFVLGGGIAFLCLRTDDTGIARMLDKELQLDERVQTALYYSGQESEMLDLQRMNMGAELGKATYKGVPFQNTVSLILCAVIAVGGIAAIPIVAVETPPAFAASAEEGKEPEEPIRPVTDWEWQALDDLIAYVKASQKADSVAKEGMAEALEGLRSVLLNGVSQSSLALFVQNTVNEIRNAVKDANTTAEEVQRALNSEEEAYVIARLHEIFNLPSVDFGDGDESNGNGDDDKDDEQKDPNNPGNGNSDWEVNDHQIPFFDPEKGYVQIEDVRDEYLERMRAAFEEGTISREEWEEILVSYFAGLTTDE